MNRTFSSDVSEDQSHLATMYLSYVLISYQSRTSIYQKLQRRPRSARLESKIQTTSRGEGGMHTYKALCRQGGRRGPSSGKREKNYLIFHRSLLKSGDGDVYQGLSPSSHQAQTVQKNPVFFVFWQRVRQFWTSIEPTSGSSENICAARTEASPVCFKQSEPG